MFTGRCPIPSARTVKLLYQLGYICSGTAAGLVTLCLEEQRRRIQTLQKVADNAKVIRQHPRYRGNLALAVEPAEDSSYSVAESEWHAASTLPKGSRRQGQGFSRGYNVFQQDAKPSVTTGEASALREDRLKETHRSERWLPPRRTLTPRYGSAHETVGIVPFRGQSQDWQSRDSGNVNGVSNQPPSSNPEPVDATSEPENSPEHWEHPFNIAADAISEIHDTRNSATRSFQPIQTEPKSLPTTTPAEGFTHDSALLGPTAETTPSEEGQSHVYDGMARFNPSSLWRATRNLNLVRAQATKWRNLHADNKAALRELDKGLLYVYVSAGRAGLAVDLAKRIQSTDGASAHTLSQVALLCAKEKSWKSLDRVLQVFRELGPFELSRSVQGTFHAVIHEYSRHDGASAPQVWRFVAEMLQGTGFKLDQVTTLLTLESFVIKRAFYLIPQWLDFADTLGCDAKVDARMAAELLREYYVDHRPSHVLIMRLCRELILRSPSLAGRSLVGLVQQAIGYDIRHASKNGLWKQTHAMMRLERVKQSGIFIPSTGLAWDEDLHFHDFGHYHEELQLDRSTKPSKMERSALKRTGSKMWLHMSLGEHQKVLDTYHKAINTIGGSVCPDFLDLAIEASLRLHDGDPSHAGGLVRQAQATGVDTTWVEGTFILHRLKRSQIETPADASSLREKVLAYCRNNHVNSSHIARYLGAAAAHSLIKHEFPAEGLSLLCSLYRSETPLRLPLNAVTMTTFLSGYIAQRSIDGVQWVVETSLAQNVRIDKWSMHELRKTTKSNFKRLGKQPQAIQELLTSWVELCEARRDQQEEESRRLGWELVDCIAHVTSEGGEADVKSKGNSADSKFVEEVTGGQVETDEADFVDESYYSDEVSDEDRPLDPLKELKERMRLDIKAEQEFRERTQKESAAMRAYHAKERPRSLAQVK